MLCDGAVNTTGFPINELWVQNNMERALLYRIYTLNYQHSNELTLQSDTKSRKWNIVATLSNAQTNIVCNNEILYYVGAHAKYFDSWNQGKLQLLGKELLSWKPCKIVL
jgi:hypothetical protein